MHESISPLPEWSLSTWKPEILTPWFCGQLGGAGAESPELAHSSAKSCVSWKSRSLSITLMMPPSFSLCSMMGKMLERALQCFSGCPLASALNKYLLIWKQDWVETPPWYALCHRCTSGNLVLFPEGYERDENRKQYAFIPAILPVTTGVQVRKRKYLI